MIKQTCKTWQDWELNSHFNSAVHQLNFVFSEIIFFFRPSQTFWFSYCASLLRVNELEFVPLSKYARILKRSISHQFLVIFASIRLSAKATWVPKDICFSWHFIAFNHTGSLINCAATTGHGLISSLAYWQGAQHWAQAQSLNNPIQFSLHGTIPGTSSVSVWAQSQERKQFEQAKLHVKNYQLYNRLE